MKKIISKILMAAFASISLQQATAQTNTFPATGNVGIGTTTPASKLDILPANGNALTIRPYGAAANNTGQLQFKELAANGANYVGFRGPDALASNLIFRLPTVYGTNGQLLSTTGSGVLTWANAGATRNLNNLTTTSINLSLIPGTTNAIDLGTSAKAWRNIYFNGKVFVIGKLFISGADNDNIYVGNNAGLNNTTGYVNTGVGTESMNHNTTGIYNTASGYQSLFTNTNGTYNSAFGAGALRLNSSGSFNCAFGAFSLAKGTGDRNTAIGEFAMYATTSGTANTAIGSQALTINVIGNYNTAAGNNALQNTNSDYNTAMGYNSLIANTSGAGNCAFGTFAMNANQTGQENLAVGRSSLFNSTGGSSNTAAGNFALVSNTTGNYNVGLGYFANVSSGALTNAIAIGRNATVNASDKMQLGSSTTTLASTGGITIVSDGRFKNDVKEEEVPGLEFIKQLRPVVYNFDYKKYDDFLTKDIKEKHNDAVYQSQLIEKSKTREVGFIAQEVDKTVREKGFTFNGVYTPQNENDNYAIDYSRLVVPLVKALQEMDKKNDALENEIGQIKSVLNTDQQQKLNEIKNSINKAALEQNIPNPFNKNTVIKYYLPENFTDAQLKIYSSQGVEMKVYTIKQSGKGELTMEANTLAAGIYSYTLIVDGNAADVKQMIITK